MRPIAIKTTKKGKKSVTLTVYSYYNTLTFADRSNNYFKTVHIINYQEAVSRFYEWTIQMHNIKTEITLYP